MAKFLLNCNIASVTIDDIPTPPTQILNLADAPAGDLHNYGQLTPVLSSYEQVFHVQCTTFPCGIAKEVECIANKSFILLHAV